MRWPLLAIVLFAAPLSAQSDSARSPSGVRRPKPGAEFLIPTVSLIPGMGQYIHGAYGRGALFTAQLAAGFYIVGTNQRPDSVAPLRDKDHQFGRVGDGLGVNAAMLSSWDTFHRSIPALQQQGKYDFLPPRRESVTSLVTAPFDYRFLGRWTTWVELVPTAFLTVALLDSDAKSYPLHGHDLGYAAAVSMNAAVGEEAFFRGYLLPMLYQKTGRRFWLANTIQGTAFLGLHGLNPATFILVGLSGYYGGWVTKRNGWSVRESVFAHFWWDAATTTATLLRERDSEVRIAFPTIRF